MRCVLLAMLLVFGAWIAQYVVRFQIAVWKIKPGQTIDLAFLPWIGR